jgi:chromosomal replication initiator protein
LICSFGPVTGPVETVARPNIFPCPVVNRRNGGIYMQETYNDIWRKIAGRVRPHLSADAFQRWFAAIELVNADKTALTFKVPNIIYQFWIESNFLNVVQGAAVSVLKSPREIRFVIADRGTTAPVVNVDTERAAESLAPISHDGNSESNIKHGLNLRYKFEAFVVGSNNEFAHAAAQVVSRSPAQTYNPLFIYGGVGLGKTHLMQAIGQETIEKRKTQKVVYLSSERFTNEFIDAIQQNMLVRFRKRYRQADVLLIDDIHFFAGKERSQEEFFHAFDTLFDGRKQIVLSSDRPPSEIGNLEQHLVSRLDCGLTTELQPPDYATRLAILRKKAETLQVELSEEVFAFIAQHVLTNVRRLEGALTRVVAYQSLIGREISCETIDQLLRDTLRKEAGKTLTIDQIQKKVAEHFEVRIADITGKRRTANIVFPRQVAMYLARRHTKASFQQIGEAFGGRDHGTALHACKTISARMKKEDPVRQTVAKLAIRLEC